MQKKVATLLTLLIGMVLVACDGTSSIVSSEPIFTPENYRTSYASVRQNMGYASALPSQGDVHVLVIPVTFTDYPCESLLGGCSTVKSEIATAFFGSAEQTGWESVSSYYEKSSYGQLHLTGFVTDWYLSESTAVSIAESKNGNAVSSLIADKALAWYQAIYHDDGKQFDSDGDGYLDAVYFIYSLDYRPMGNGMPEDTSVFWAFTAYTGGQKNVNEPGLFHYVWASYAFIHEDGYYERDDEGYLIIDEHGEYIFHNWTDDEGKILIDSHTYIHETGHLLGLSDYYSYDEVGWGPAGALDMMDYNIGDHNAYSKTVLGWIKPKVVVNTVTVTISPFEENGDFLLLTPEYHETLCDEYLALEFYAPTSLNEKDSIEPFAGYYPRLFSELGIKVYHVDARLARFHSTNGDASIVNYTTVLSANLNGDAIRIAHSNTSSQSGNPNFKLIHLLESSGKSSFKHGGIATGDTLFTEGMSFGYDTFANYAFNSGVALGYKFTVTSITASGATLEIVKI